MGGNALYFIEVLASVEAITKYLNSKTFQATLQVFTEELHRR